MYLGPLGECCPGCGRDPHEETVCISCGRPEDEHLDEWGGYTPCLEQIGETMASEPVTHDRPGKERRP